MGGNNNRSHSKRSSFSLLSFFKPRRSHRVEHDSWDDVVYTRKAWASDEDKRYWVAEPGIDRKASAFIAKFHATRVSESERQTLPPYQSERA
ncbi:PREDICTED: uncharacterized protein LOC104818754 [Tarenaya hassleriana]|uniref:uncharacterized protein LOC104818754 n=1 Tax=Tarenaya hassleriana TaxID=28532 RepID=UPI00053C36EE|nr:PREDICTED: uncharacterized protein LOC104818754 [Tarenaya hassleriana]